MAVVLNNPSVWRYTAPCARAPSPRRDVPGRETADAGADDAGEALAGRVIELMRAAGMPNGLAALGFGDADVDALATGAEPQYRVIRNAPKDVSRDDLRGLFSAAMKYW